jgi:hypothetical protein
MLLVLLLFIESNHMYNALKFFIVHGQLLFWYFLLQHCPSPIMNTQVTISIAKIRLDHSTPMRQLVDKVLAFLLTCIEVKQAARIDSDELKSWQSNKHKKFQTVGKHLPGNVYYAESLDLN